MPELPDIIIYVEALRERVLRQRLRRINIANPFLVRSVEPAVDALLNRTVVDVSRLAKRIVVAFDGDMFVVLHLMIAGRLLWRGPPSSTVRQDRQRLSRRGKHPAEFEFDTGTVILTEAGTTRRASMYVVSGAENLAAHDPGGLDPLTATYDEFACVMRRGNHTLKRALTNQQWFSGIGNAYSDEILHAAGMPPTKLTSSLTQPESMRLFETVQLVLSRWIVKLREAHAGRFPGIGEVTAFRPEFAVHGKFGLPCPVCNSTVQRIRRAENEINYCPGCQTGGRILADRSLSRLLGEDWPDAAEEWSSMQGQSDGRNGGRP